jgi:hypothetical protein
MANASAVSRYLGQKFTKGEEWSSGSVRGWINFSSGYKVRSQEDGSVRVEYQEGDGARTNSEEVKEARAKRELEAYREHLAQRYTVELVEDGLTYRTQWLKVTEKAAPGPVGPLTELPGAAEAAVADFIDSLRRSPAQRVDAAVRRIVLDAINADRADWAKLFDAQCGEHGRANGPGLLLAAMLIRPEVAES